MSVRQAHIMVSGKVQGVFYRHVTKTRARDLGLAGWVKNLADGSVEIFARGTEKAIKDLAEWCHKGPPNAVVNKVLVDWEDIDSTGGTTDGDFEIR